MRAFHTVQSMQAARPASSWCTLMMSPFQGEQHMSGAAATLAPEGGKAAPEDMCIKIPCHQVHRNFQARCRCA